SFDVWGRIRLTVLRAIADLHRRAVPSLHICTTAADRGPAVLLQAQPIADINVIEIQRFSTLYSCAGRGVPMSAQHKIRPLVVVLAGLSSVCATAAEKDDGRLII